jgi:hypothetical protein
VQQQSTQTSTTKKIKTAAATLREVLRHIIRTNRKKSDDKIRTLFELEVRNNERLLSEVINDYFDRNYVLMTRQLEISMKGIKEPYVDERQLKKDEFQDLVRLEKEKIVTKVEKLIRDKAKIALLDMLLPNGKLLRNCTAEECRSLAPVVGAWLEKVADNTGPSASIVGQNLSEEQVQNLWQTAK